LTPAAFRSTKLFRLPLPEAEVTNPISRRALLLGAAMTPLAGCAVPRGAPSRAEVLSGSTSEDADFALEIVTRDRLPVIAGWGGDQTHLTHHWPSGGASPQDQRLAAGDRIELRIWDASDSSLLTSPGAQFADVTNVVVTGSGNVELPYISAVPVAGLTLSAARARIQDRLTEIVPDAQVQAEVQQGRRNSVDLVGGVANPGTYPLTELNLPLTALLSTAGGAASGLENPVVQITRGGNVYRRTLAHVLANPAHDPALQGGDRIVLQPDPRTFTALGAAGSERVIRFDSERISALRAVSMMGGMNDARADPKGILVLRRYGDTHIGNPGGPSRARVVFSFDLTSADGLFSADEFAIRDGDVVLATQAPATTAERVLRLFGAFLGSGRTVLQTSRAL
jgi:polysaccharide export outer membrane protein